MKTVKYILVNENACQNVDRLVRDSFVSDLRQCVICDAGSKFWVQGSKERADLIGRLVRLRRHHPDAPILGLSELAPHCVHPSEAMNLLRRELSDWP